MLNFTEIYLHDSGVFLSIYVPFVFLLSLVVHAHLSVSPPRFWGIVYIKDPPAKQETWVRSLGQEDLLEKGMATHPSILAWRIPWTEEPGGLQFTESQIAGHD